MAAHQYQFGLLPRGPLVEKYGALPQYVAAEDFFTAWQQQPKYEVSCLIERFASSYQSWSPDIRMWGSENGNRVHVVYENARIVEVTCRLSLRMSFEDFASGVILLAIQCDWMLVLTNDALAPPNLNTLLAAVVTSNAAKFVTNPIEFIEGLSTGKYAVE